MVLSLTVSHLCCAVLEYIDPFNRTSVTDFSGEYGHCQLAEAHYNNLTYKLNHARTPAQNPSMASCCPLNKT